MPRGIHNVRHKCSGRSSFWRNCRRTFRSGIRSGSGFPWSSSVPSESASTRFVWADVEPPGSLQPAVFFSSSPRFSLKSARRPPRNREVNIAARARQSRRSTRTSSEAPSPGMPQSGAHFRSAREVRCVAAVGMPELRWFPTVVRIGSGERWSLLRCEPRSPIGEFLSRGRVCGHRVRSGRVRMVDCEGRSGDVVASAA